MVAHAKLICVSDRDVVSDGRLLSPASLREAKPTRESGKRKRSFGK